MRIGLYGIGGVYNFGCEAIVRGATQLIRKLYTKPEIVYFSYNYEYDNKALADLNICVYKIQKDRRFLPRVINKACCYLNTERHPLLNDFKTMMSMVDEVWSIGGDIYTIPAILREHRTYPYYNSVIDFCDQAVHVGKKVVLYGASVGPFGEYEKAVTYYVKNLRKYHRILCREPVTLEYLKQLGLANVMFFPDPAFQVGGESEDDSNVARAKNERIFLIDRKYIGVNLSPLSLNELFGGHSEKNIIKIAGLMDKIVLEFNKEILFIPHVISHDENDDDLRFQQAVINFMKTKDRTAIADYKNGFIGLKHQIRQCEFVVSARMHCAINAIHENVPAILLSYSSKSVGMCEYIYGDCRWLLSLKDAEKGLLDRMKEMDGEVEEISAKLSARNVEIQDEYDRLVGEL